METLEEVLIGQGAWYADDEPRFCRIVGQWMFNENGVCINPEPVFDERIKSGYNASIEVCQVESSRWAFGYGYDCFNESYSGGGCSCHLNEEETFETRVEAICGGIDYLLAKIHDNSKNKKLIDFLLSQKKAHQPIPVKTELIESDGQYKLFA